MLKGGAKLQKIVKHMMRFVLALMLSVVFIPMMDVAADGVSVIIDEQRVNFDDQEPIIVDGRTLVPLRGVFEVLGFEVNWYESSQQVLLTRDNGTIIDTIIITIGRDVFSVNGLRHYLEVPAQIIEGRTMLPIRAVLESVGYEVLWDDATSTIYINSPHIEEVEELIFDVSQVRGEAANISAGAGNSFVIRDNGELCAVGWNAVGQLGDGTTTDRREFVRVLNDVVAVSSGRIHTMAIRGDGSLWGWGGNYAGRLGDGTTLDRHSPVRIMGDVVAVSAGDDHTMAIRSDGSLWAWGFNREGQLGDGTTRTRYSPVKIMEDVAAVSAGRNHTMVIRTDGSLWAFGDNSYGQFGNGTTSQLARSREGNWYESLPNPTPVRVKENVISVSAGDGHTIAIMAEGSSWFWGLYLMRGDNSAWGHDNESGYFIPYVYISEHFLRPQRLRVENANLVFAGLYTNMIVTEDGSLWTWGLIEFIPIGTAEDIPRDEPIRIMYNVNSATGRFGHVMVVRNDGSLWVFGENQYGQLGDGTFMNRNTPTRVMRDVMLSR